MNNQLMSAINYATERHVGQKRKYTGNPYTDHLHEVAGLATAFGLTMHMLPAAYLHDVLEDTIMEGETVVSVFDQIYINFGPDIASVVMTLSSIKKGSENRNARLEAYRKQIMGANGYKRYVDIIKAADIYSNCSTMCTDDPKFFVTTYHQECSLMLECLTSLEDGVRIVVSEHLTKCLAKAQTTYLDTWLQSKEIFNV